MTELLLKATIAMTVALIVVAFAKRARASMRHAVLSAMFILLLLLPFSSVLMPKVEVPVPEAVRPAVIAASPAPPVIAVPSTSVERENPVDVLRIVMFGYATVAGLLLLSLATGIWRLRRWSDRGTVWIDGIIMAGRIANASGIRRAVFVVLSDDVDVPMTFGFGRQTIILPSTAPDWNADELQRAIRHELEHVRRDDWAMQLIARTAAAVYWPHPLAWMALRRFCVEAERACDDSVVGLFEPSSYASQLLTLAQSLRARTNVPALSMASPTRLGERVRAILDTTQVRGPQGRIGASITVAVMMAVLLSFGSVKLVAQNAVATIAQRVAIADGVPSGSEDEDAYSEVVVKAAEQGNVRLLGKLLDDGLDINRSYDGDGTALLVAARYGQIDTVKFLIGRGADLNVPSPGDGNPLIAASQVGNLDVARLLLDSRARVDDIVPGDETALINAAEAGHAEVARLLISRGANVNLRVWVDGNYDRPAHWRSPLERARRNGDPEIIRMLEAAGAKN
ncbi:MAG: ankyrin repeat domain-containing protein [Thermoanaerobaculia bacterium]|nr:ankyrin repeat domain-containing protein [Thermoanaerobaculia bacterium]